MCLVILMLVCCLVLYLLNIINKVKELDSWNTKALLYRSIYLEMNMNDQHVGIVGNVGKR